MSPNSQQQDLSDQKQHKRTQKRPCQLEVNQRILTGRGNHTPESSLHCSHGFVPQGSLRVRNAPEVATLPCAGGPGVAWHWGQITRNLMRTSEIPVISYRPVLEEYAMDLRVYTGVNDWWWFWGHLKREWRHRL